MMYATIADLPAAARCKLCAVEKPLAEMIVVLDRRGGGYRVRPRCKACHNARERGHRREWKRAYCQRWRKRHADWVRGYWHTPETRERQKLRARERVAKHHDALLIQGRLRRQLGQHVTLAEATKLLALYGCCYPTPAGLSDWGRREAERIRSRMRASGRHMKPVEIRAMVYADGKRNYVKPRFQRPPYQAAAAKLREWWARRAA